MEEDKIERHYWDNGKVQWEIPSVNGKMHGLMKHYHSNGTKASVGTFENDRRVGIKEMWNDDEERTFIVNFNEGSLNGIYVQFLCWF